MSIEFHCPQCEKLLRVPEGTAGKKAKCPQCSAVVQIPAASEPDAVGAMLADIPASPPPAAIPPSANPYQAPSTSGRLVSGEASFDELIKVATSQKVILICILIQIIAVILQFAANEPVVVLLIATVSLVTGIVAVVFLVRLALMLYGTGLAIVLGIFSFFPCIGLLILLMVSGKATSMLKANGVKVGLLGANLAEMRASRPAADD